MSVSVADRRAEHRPRGEPRRAGSLQSTDCRISRAGRLRSLAAARFAVLQQVDDGEEVGANPMITTDWLQAFADAWNQHDVDALMSFMTEDCVFEASAGPAVS